MVIVPASTVVAEGLTFTVGQITWTTHGGSLTTTTSGETQIHSGTAEASIPITLTTRTRPTLPRYRAKRVDNSDVLQALDHADHKLLEASNLVDSISRKPDQAASTNFFDSRRSTRVTTHKQLETSLTITSTPRDEPSNSRQPPQTRTALMVWTTRLTSIRGILNLYLARRACRWARAADQLVISSTWYPSESCQTIRLLVRTPATMFLILANVSYWPGRVVVRDGDTFVDSYIVHPPLIGQVEFVLRSKSCYVLIYFSNVPYTWIKSLLCYIWSCR